MKKENSNTKYNNLQPQLHINNDSSYIYAASDIGYCLKCYCVLMDGQVDFCDSGCRREYYSEMNRDLGVFKGSS